MSSKETMTHAATKTDVGEIIEPPAPRTAPTNPSPIINHGFGSATTRLSRRERRHIFWAPISEKMRERRESRQGDSATFDVRSRDVYGTPGSGSRGNIQRAGSQSDGRQAQCRRWDDAHQTGSRIDSRHTLVPIHPQTPPPPRYTAEHHLRISRDVNDPYSPQPYPEHFAVLESDRPSHAFMHNLRGFDHRSLVSFSHDSQPGQLYEQSPSSATYAEDAGRPVSTLTPMDEYDQPTRTRPVPDQAEQNRSVLGMAPPSPPIPSTTHLRIDDDLEPISADTSEVPLMPDVESSSSAPRSTSNHWDDRTQVADTQEQIQPRSAIADALPSSKQVVEMLFSGMKEPPIGAIRSWTFPGRESCIQFPVCVLVVEAWLE